MKLTGAEILIETLIEQGTETVFGYPGGAVLNIYDELYKNCLLYTSKIAGHNRFFRKTCRNGRKQPYG